MNKIVRTDASNLEFQKLVSLLDRELAERDGPDNIFYSQYNFIEGIKYAVVLYHKMLPAGCGAIKSFDENSMEIKRMFVIPKMRGNQMGTSILSALENWAFELGYGRCVLETGKRQPEAIRLYLKNGYKIIPNYGQYQGIENSVCFEKLL